jgi:hypothetical protein
MYQQAYVLTPAQDRDQGGRSRTFPSRPNQSGSLNEKPPSKARSRDATLRTRENSMRPAKQDAKVLPINSLSREKWRTRITDAWNKQIIDIFEVGVLLEAAKEELVQGEWGEMVKDELPFNRITAFKLIAVSRDEKLRDVSPGKHLPANWTILYDLTTLTAEQFDAAIESGAIHPKMKRSDVAVLRGIEPKKKEPSAAARPSVIDTRPSTLDGWWELFSVELTRAVNILPKAERLALFDNLDQAMRGLRDE